MVSQGKGGVFGGSGPFDDDDSRPKPPLDPIPEFEPKGPKDGGDPLDRFEILIDPDFLLADEAVRRIEKHVRLAVLTEIAGLDALPDFQLTRSSRGGTRRLEIALVRE